MTKKRMGINELCRITGLRLRAQIYQYHLNKNQVYIMLALDNTPRSPKGDFLNKRIYTPFRGRGAYSYLTCLP
jgi:hypothetical protein